MKLLLLHGPGKISSRAKLINIKQKFNLNNVMVFDEGSKLDEVVGSLMTQAIFDEEKLFILENPDESFTNYTLNPNPYTLIFWFDHEVAEKKPIMEWVKEVKGEIYFFPEAKEVSVFPFLDLLATGNKNAFLELSKLKIAGYDIFYLITMTFYLLRNLVATPKNAPPFVKQKLDKQRKRFSQNDLKNLYKDILEIEFKIKKGLLEIPQAEFLLVNKFLTN